MKKILALLIALALSLFLGINSAHAVKPHASVTPASISIDQAFPSLGEWVTFTTTYPKNTKNPRVQVMCYQAGVLVWATADHPDVAFLLGGASSDWLTLGGPADCEADLFSVWWSGGQPQKVEMLASTSFTA